MGQYNIEMNGERIPLHDKAVSKLCLMGIFIESEE